MKTEFFTCNLWKALILTCLMSFNSILHAFEEIEFKVTEEETFATRISGGKTRKPRFGSQSAKVINPRSNSKITIVEGGLKIDLSGKTFSLLNDEGSKALRGGLFAIDEESFLQGELFSDINTGELTLFLYKGNPKVLEKIIRFAQ